MWGLGTLRLYPPHAWLLMFQEQSLSQLPYFTTQNFSNCIWAFARIAHWPAQVSQGRGGEGAGAGRGARQRLWLEEGMTGE